MNHVNDVNEMLLKLGWRQARFLWHGPMLKACCSAVIWIVICLLHYADQQGRVSDQLFRGEGCSKECIMSEAATCRRM
jgi:hypothetical protein